MKYFKVLFFFLLISMPVQADESEIVVKLRESIRKFFLVAESLVFKKDVKPDPKPIIPVKCDCNGTGWITQGDGNRTPCPKYPGCTKGAVVNHPTIEEIKPNEIIVVPDEPPAKLHGYIKMYSLSTCAPCKQWKEVMKSKFEKAGWRVDIEENSEKYSRFPTFEVYNFGNLDVVQGFLTAEENLKISSKYTK